MSRDHDFEDLALEEVERIFTPADRRALDQAIARLREHRSQEPAPPREVAPAVTRGSQVSLSLPPE